jgi:hypothetical protein
MQPKLPGCVKVQIKAVFGPMQRPTPVYAFGDD